jgi:hypothetical protein
VQHPYDRSVTDGSRYLDLWQVKIARRWGPPGLLAALLGSGLLLAGGAAATARLVNAVSLSSRHPSLPTSQQV